MESIRELFDTAGTHGIYILVSATVSFVLLITFTVILRDTKKYSYTVVFTVIPFLIGLLGTVLWRMKTSAFIANSKEVFEQSMIDSFYRVSWAPLKLSIYFSVPLVIIFILSLLIKGRKFEIEE